MKYFLDFGSHMFEGLEEFKIKLGIDKSWIIYCYEANPFVFQKALQYLHKLDLNINLLNLAVYDKNDKISFDVHLGAFINGVFYENYDTGSNCLSIDLKKDPGNNANFIIKKVDVQSIDVLDILNNICKVDDLAELFIKCDIEGSEFLVLPRILQSKYVNRIKKIFIEWHDRFWLDLPDHTHKLNEKNNILDCFRDKNIETFNHT